MHLKAKMICNKQPRANDNNTLDSFLPGRSTLHHTPSPWLQTSVYCVLVLFKQVVYIVHGWLGSGDPLRSRSSSGTSLFDSGRFINQTGAENEHARPVWLCSHLIRLRLHKAAGPAVAWDGFYVEPARVYLSAPRRVSQKESVVA
jgi:hypothetical protein